MIFCIVLICLNDSLEPSPRKEASLGVRYPWGISASVSYWWTPNFRSSLVMNKYKEETSTDPGLSSSVEILHSYRMPLWKSLFCGIESGVGFYLLSKDGINSLEPGIPFSIIGGLWLGKDSGIYIKWPNYYIFRDSKFYISSSTCIGGCKRIRF